ncbi:carbohydrate sulfotransferase 11-like [Liolophura sinensis]|uniref:carbohydrate sulfotransferase 11-like n=1 Tax=Liolophura sinensis TaxID=3198878 RepID=UPI00315978CE
MVGVGHLGKVCQIPLQRDLRFIEGRQPVHKLGNVYRGRRDHLVSTCSNPNISSIKGSNQEVVVRDHFFVDHKHKAIYCGIEKVGCTFWKRVLQISTGLRSQKNPYDIPGHMAHSHRLQTFRGMRFDEILDIVSSYTKFLFVRDPYSRLFSCYIDKLFSPNYAYFALRVKIFNMGDKRVSNNESSCAPYISFRQFLKFVIYALKTGDGRDGHFVPMYDHCRPCQVRYDIIGKMEHFLEDAEYVIKVTGISDTVEFNSSRGGVDEDTVMDIVTNLNSSSQKIKTCMPLSMAIKYVWRKCQINGIIDKNIEMPEKFAHITNFDGEDLSDALLAANKMSDRERARRNRHEALLEAYRSVSQEDLQGFKTIFKPDFDIFRTTANIMVRGNRADSGGNAGPSAGSCQTF